MLELIKTRFLGMDQYLNYCPFNFNRSEIGAILEPSFRPVLSLLVGLCDRCLFLEPPIMSKVQPFSCSSDY